jgi:hypothetical protein
MRRISIEKKRELEGSVGWMMMAHDGRLLWLKSCKIETKIETPTPTFWVRNPEPVENIYLTEIKLLSYNEDGKFLGTYDYDAAYEIIKYNDLYAMRGKWHRLKEQLKSFGLEVIHQDEPKRFENQEVEIK